MDRDDDHEDQEARQQAARLVSGARSALGENPHAFLDWLAVVCRAHRTTIHPTQSLHAFREGRRSVYYDILKLIEMTPEHIGAIGERRSRR